MLLVSNDDGVHAPGLAALVEGLAAWEEVVVVAPAEEQSAKSHGLTMHKPLRILQVKPGWYATSGTPADCVYLALHHLLPRRPTAVLSGINRGSNLGNDVHYSGTVAAAREAALNGLPALAVSLHTADSPPDQPLHWGTAVHFALQVLHRMHRAPLPGGVYLNLNVPDRPLSEVRGLQLAPAGERLYTPQVKEGHDPRGKPYYWIGGPPLGFGGGDDTDGAMLARGYATVSPLRIDTTDHTAMDALREMFSGE